MRSIPCARACTLYLVWWLLATVMTTTAAPPEIVIIEDAGGPSVTLSSGTRAHHVIPKAVQVVELKCQAGYPVMWKDIHSIVYPGVIGAESERIVDVARFDQPDTYMYSMTLRWQLLGKESADGTSFVCLAAGQENGTLVSNLSKNMSTVLTMKWDRSLQAFMCSLGSKTNNAKIGSLPDMTISLDQSAGFGSKVAVKVTCCFREGIHPGKDYRHMRLGYGDCPEPLLCIKKNTTLKGEFEWWPSSGEGRCGSVHLFTIEESPVPVPGVAACEIKGEQTGDWIGFRLMDTGEYSWQEYKSLLDNSKTREWTRAKFNMSDPVTFYTRDTVVFRCQTSTIYYAKGIVWELEFKNGTTQFMRASSDKIAADWTMIMAMLRLSFVHDADVDSLVRLSCHIPPWNSTEWVTYSSSVVVQPSSAPTSLSGSSLTRENVTFYTHESVQLQCDLSGQPHPKFEWETESSVYSSFVPDSKTSARVSVRWQRWIKDPRTPRHPEDIFSCTATNVAGNATKVFNVQAIQSFEPILAKTAREAVVLYAGDRAAVLNCSLTQGVPAPHFIWQKHGENISADDDTFQINTTDKWSVLIFKIVRLDDEAEYTCNSTNVLGSVTKEFSVRIRERPVSPVSVPESSHWNGLTITLLIVALILFIALTFLWFRKNKKIARLQTRVEFASFKMEPFESKVTLDTLTE